jgi:hypothetical protein
MRHHGPFLDGVLPEQVLAPFSGNRKLKRQLTDSLRDLWHASLGIAARATAWEQRSIDRRERSTER